jgi:hypothetical protein
MIYFVQMQCPNGYVKIGVAVELAQRLDKLQNASPYGLDLIRVLPGGLKEERELHRRFAASHVRREWFRPTDDLMAFVEEKAPDCLGADAPREANAPKRGSVFVRRALDRMTMAERRQELWEVRRTRIEKRKRLKRFAEPERAN